MQVHKIGKVEVTPKKITTHFLVFPTKELAHQFIDSYNATEEVTTTENGYSYSAVYLGVEDIDKDTFDLIAYRGSRVDMPKDWEWT